MCSDTSNKLTADKSFATLPRDVRLVILQAVLSNDKFQIEFNGKPVKDGRTKISLIVDELGFFSDEEYRMANGYMVTPKYM